jgi:hypothetical protein
MRRSQRSPERIQTASFGHFQEKRTKPPSTLRTTVRIQRRLAAHLGHVSNFHRTKRVAIEPMKPLAIERPADLIEASVLHGHPDGTRLEPPIIHVMATHENRAQRNGRD